MPQGFGRKGDEERELALCMTIPAIIISFFIVSTSQLPPKVVAQTTSEAAKVLVDDAY
jgi:hypothetical protein